MENYPELAHGIASPPQELAILINNLIDMGEPRIAANIPQEGMQPLALEQALLEEQARQVQIEEDAALADLLQDDDDEVLGEVSAEEDNGFESENIEDAVPEGAVTEEGQPMDVAEVNSDAETIDNHPDEVESDSVSDSDDSDMDEVQRDEEMGRMRRRLPGIQRRIRRRCEDYIRDAPRRYRDRCYGCAKRFWCQHNRRWIRCASCGFWLCPDCNVDPVHCQNERQFLP